jgi:hypothetical protein
MFSEVVFILRSKGTVKWAFLNQLLNYSKKGACVF